MCLCTCFEFSGDMYEKSKGSPMGSPLSVFLSEAIMHALNIIGLPRIQPKLWNRYVDDIKRSNMEETNKIINFTMESENDGEMIFLDVLVKINAKCTLEITVYRRQTHTGQIVNYRSNSSINHKRS